MTHFRVPLALVLVMVAVLLAAGCIGTLTGNGINEASLTGSDRQFVNASLTDYSTDILPFRYAMMQAMEDHNWERIKTNAEGMKNVSDTYGVLLSSNNYTVSPKLQKFQSTVNKQISMDSCTADYWIRAADMEEINDSARKDYYLRLARECTQASNRAGQEILLMIY